MLKSLTLASVLALAVVGLNTVPASARTTAAQCQAIYDQSLGDPQSYRTNRDEYIRCVGQL